MARVEVDGTPLEVVEAGAGAPLVLVHGSGSDLRTWDLQRDALARHFRVIAYSRRHHWPNPTIPPDAEYAMLEHVDDLCTLLETLDLGSVHLVGHSYGGFLCLLLAIRAPERVRTLVLAEPPVVPLFLNLPPKPAELLGLLLRRPRVAFEILKFVATGLAPATTAARRGDRDEAIRRFATAVLGRAHFESLSDARREQIRANPLDAELLGSGLAPLAAEEVGRVDVPTLLVTGERSPRLFHHLTDRLAELLPHVERVQIRAASHTMHEENPAEFDAAVLSFLARYERAA